MARLKSNMFTDSLIEQQLEIERLSSQAGAISYREKVDHTIERGDGASLPPAERLMTHWHPMLVELIKKGVKQINKGVHKTGLRTYGPYLKLIPIHITAQITLYQMLTLCMREPDGVPKSKMCYEIGNHCLAEIQCYKLSKQKLTKRYRDGKKYSTNQMTMLMQMVDKLDPKSVHRKAKCMDLEDPAVWSKRVAVNLGAYLMMSAIGIASTRDYSDNPNDFHLAFHWEKKHLHNSKSRRKTTVIRMDDEAFALLEEGHMFRQYLRPRFMPMIIPPMAWSKELEGGYIRIRKPLVTKIHPSQRRQLNETEMPEFYKGINAVSSTAWKVNPRIYDLLCKSWESGGGLAGVPNCEDTPMPPRDETLIKGTKEWKKSKRDRWQIHHKNVGRRGMRSIFLKRISTATKMMDYDRFYLPHQVDFRGRIYPMPFDLNPQSDDMSRSMMMFADSVPLGKHGDRNLKINAANLYGIDKCSYDDREKWTDDNADMIRRCASEPFSRTNEEFWTRADSPWQFLAACYALDGDNTATHLSVHVDGTCNGLQHYAAIGRDERAARLVNMIPCDEPCDTYSEVCAEARRLAFLDSEQGHREADMIAEHIVRKHIKQPVMTTVYGVTVVGIRKQIYNQLDKLGYTESDRYKISQYLCDVTKKAIGNTCDSAEQLMNWLKDVAAVILGSTAKDNDFISWESPIGFPVVQRYMEPVKIEPKTCAGRLRMYTAVENTKVKKGKQKSSFPPNVIHAMDSSHLYMTSIRCKDNGISLSTIHDSFGTHACNVQQLQSDLIDTFVEMHEQDPIGQMLKGFQDQYPDREFPTRPTCGKLDLNVLRESYYMFS